MRAEVTSPNRLPRGRTTSEQFLPQGADITPPRGEDAQAVVDEAADRDSW